MRLAAGSLIMMIAYQGINSRYWWSSTAIANSFDDRGHAHFTQIQKEKEKGSGLKELKDEMDSLRIEARGLRWIWNANQSG